MSERSNQMVEIALRHHVNAHLVQRSVTLFVGPVGSPNEAHSNIDWLADSSTDDMDKKLHTPFLGWAGL